MKLASTIVLVMLAAAIPAYLIVTHGDGRKIENRAVTIKYENLEGLSVATFAGGCFWCVEAAFEAVPGVKEAVSGYSGGEIENPTYKQVAYGLTKHTEAVQVHYDPNVITYEGLLQVLWRTADPTDSKGQFSDRGRQYRPAIFYHDERQRRAALRSRQELAKSGPFKKPITIEIVPFKAFYQAEDYHQDYHRKNPLTYRFYTVGSGRYGFLERVWENKLKLEYSKYKPMGHSSNSVQSKSPETIIIRRN